MGDTLLQILLLVVGALFLPLIFYIRWCIRFYRLQPYMLYQPRRNLIIKTHDKTVTHEEIEYLTPDNKKISAWFVPAANNETITEENHEKTIKRVVLFCHGNAGDISQRLDSFKIFQQLGLDTFIFDYRGYGKSRGRPSEMGTYLDAEGAWHYLVDEMKVKQENIIIFGRSLGGGVASYLAAKYQPLALIIESSFTSAPDMAAVLHPWLPVKWLTRYQYNTYQRLKTIQCPLLVIHSPEDEVIPYDHALKIYQKANTPKQFLEIRGPHLLGFVESGAIYSNGLKEFLKTLS